MANFIDNVRFALTGIKSFFSSEKNGRIQGVIAIVVVTVGIICRLSRMEWLLVAGCIALVIGLEMVNSAIEKICNLISTEYNPAIKTIKDIAAGAVLWAAIIAAIIGAVVFVPHVYMLFY